MTGNQQPQRPLIAELQCAARDAADHEFLRFMGASYTFRDIHQQVERAASYLMANSVEGENHVAIRLPNGPAWVVSWLAIMRIGAVAVPTNYAYGVGDLAYVLADSGAVAVITDSDSQSTVNASLADAGCTPTIIDVEDLWQLEGEPDSNLPDVGDIELASLANLQYTSGTTGFPKACMLSHDYWVKLGQIIVRHTHVDGSDVLLTAQPFSYIDPQRNTAVCLLARIPLVIMPRFSASRFWKMIREHKVTLFYVLGTMPTLLYKQPDDPDDLHNDVRLVVCSGIPPALHANLEQRWGAPWREAFGMTETGVDIAVPQSAVDCVGSGTIGWPVESKQARVVNSQGNDVDVGTTGELILRGKPMMDGYWNKPKETAEVLRRGWFHTGDLVVQAQSGSFKVVGRMKDMVRRSGENIAAAEVENVANTHGDVVSSAVIGIPDDLWGEEVKLFVQPRRGAVPSRELAESIGNHIRGRLAHFKSPRYVEFVDSFPMTPSERISKPNIPARFSIDKASVFELDYGELRRRTQ